MRICFIVKIEREKGGDWGAGLIFDFMRHLIVTTNVLVVGLMMMVLEVAVTLQKFS